MIILNDTVMVDNRDYYVQKDEEGTHIILYATWWRKFRIVRCGHLSHELVSSGNSIYRIKLPERHPWGNKAYAVEVKYVWCPWFMETKLGEAKCICFRTVESAKTFLHSHLKINRR